ncbi:hypothetical protein MMC08_000373 [Hypocenomyce scalaris]|nr:hypothetical protein [Hypocenomyce scalaris]
MCSVSPQVAADASRFSLPLYQLQELSEKAIDAKARAYCPYSKFRVGAALLTTDGQYIAGANIENASYPVGTCAERVALVKAVSEGQMNFKALALATDISPPGPPSPHQQNTYSNPFVVPKPHHQNSELILLSICSLPLRHVPSIVRSPPSFPQLTPGIFTSPSDLNYSIREFCPLTLPIFMHGKDGNYVVKTLQELLPMSFGPEDLKPGPGPRSESQLADNDVEVKRGDNGGAGAELMAAETNI